MNLGRHIYLEKTAQAPSPSKDFHQLIVQDGEVLWRTWRISARKDQRYIPPSQRRVPWEDFDDDALTQMDIHRVFGDDTLRLVHSLVCGDWLVRLPSNTVVHIASYLDLIDVSRLGSVCKFLRKVCSSDELWEKIYRSHCDTITDEIRELAKDVGWKKVFFTNRLQLQVLMKRKKDKENALKKRASELKKQAEIEESHHSSAFLTKNNNDD
ncbi:predicted protein [Nematostella vectensis]|uniref:F-box domain-containing protein n=1 Tax=Nematostella vectensis TaxID=45351 RepID=A7SRI6_NEMVE|nr:F-box only protein 36 [Nematostella vectensis]EDO33681.1 predicted protein [Nematostella vectensis]|eukprot:XP_001625781.1 predicted protein [Nematostella vectensis]